MGCVDDLGGREKEILPRKLTREEGVLKDLLIVKRKSKSRKNSYSVDPMVERDGRKFVL